LQEVLLKVTYDGGDEPSMLLPVGDFFGQPWRERHFGSLPIGSGTNGFSSRIPMPYASGIRIDLLNPSPYPIKIRSKAVVKNSRSPDDGYLHAWWRKSGSEDEFDHNLIRISGSGKYIGASLGLTGRDKDWWILEGNERISIDGESNPSWLGTGIEDYFNGGWYYSRSAFSALFGCMDRAPLRVSQFRFHLTDPIRFKKSFDMEFERMKIPGDTGAAMYSRGTFRTVAYAYLSKPAKADPPASIEYRRAEVNPYEKNTVMLQLNELDRMNNFQKALDLIGEMAELYPQFHLNPILQLRGLEYRQLLGEHVTPDDYAPYLEGTYGEAASQLAQALMFLEQDESSGLVGLNVNGAATVSLDGQPILTGNQPL
ncbi:MAG: glycoside hydrolase family 172 protein, partial [Verrucomicrobiota bacterium]